MKPRQFAIRLVAIVTIALVLAGWVMLVMRLSNPALLPGGYTSDSAIPVLMSNDDAFRVESLYYWGQDRFSGVPFLVGSVVHRVTRFFWTPVALSMLQAAWAVLSVLVMWRWSRSVAVAVLLGGLLLVGRGAELIFDLAQPYAWQLTWTLLAAMVLDRQLEAPTAPRFAALLFLTWMAHAANAMSGTWLLAMVAFELIRATRQQRFTRAKWVLVPVMLGVVLEAAVRGLYQLRYADVHLRSVVTRTTLSFDHLPTQLLSMLGRFAWWQLASALVCLGLCGVALRRSDVPRWLIYPAICVLLNMLMPPLVLHIQQNFVAEKYFALAFIFAPFVALGAVAWRLGPSRLAPLVVLPAIVLGPLFAPPVEADAHFAEHLQTGRALAAHAPSSFLASGYWDTYLLASLVERPALTPIGRHGQLRRTDHLFASIAGSDQVWVGDQGADGEGGALPFEALLRVGTDLFEPQGEVLQLEHGAYRRYRAVAVPKKERVKICVDRPLRIDGVALISPDYPAVFEGASQEGLLWRTEPSVAVRLLEPRCIDAWVFQ